MLVMNFPHTTETDVYTKSLPMSDSLQVINLPECSLPSTSNITSSMTALLEAQKPNVKQAVTNLTSERGENGVLAAFVVDMFCTTMIDVAKEFFVPTLVFYTSGVSFLGLVLHLHTLREQDNVDSDQLLELTELAIPSFSNLVPTKSLPTIVLRKKWEWFFMSYAKGLKNADGIIVNSFEELESYAVHSFASHSDFVGLPVYPVGPILNPEPKIIDLLYKESFGLGFRNERKPILSLYICNQFSFVRNRLFFKNYPHKDFVNPGKNRVEILYSESVRTRFFEVIQDYHTQISNIIDSHDILKWLDDQPPSSVVFLCFGSRGSFDDDQVKDIALAIENSRARFVWSLRKPPLKGTMASPSDYPLSDLNLVLPEGFLDRTREIGMVIGWAPQAQILAHGAIGGFVSHCGWNSTLESIYFGVPIATWPLYAEQQSNAFELVCELKMGVEIVLDYRVEVNSGPNYFVTVYKIERGMRRLLDKEGEFRKKVKDMSEKSRKTLLEGGSSYAYLGSLIDYIVNQISN